MRLLLSLFLSGLVLLSTTSFTLNAHYCGGKVTGWSLSDGASSCNKKNQKGCSRHFSFRNPRGKSCCDEKTFIFQARTLEAITTFSAPTVQCGSFDFFPPWAENLAPIYRGARSLMGYLFYKPPNPGLDLQVLLQTFLI